MRQFTLPAFYCPFPSEIHPQVEEVHEHTLNWAKKYRLIQRESAVRRLSGARYAWLAARIHPRANFAELALANDFLNWLSMIDDQFDEGEAGRQPARMRVVIDRLLATLGIARGDEEIQPLQGPIAEALLDLWERAKPLTTPRWQRRFAGHLCDYLDSYIWETALRASGEVPDVSLYIEKRQDTGAMHLALDYIDLVEHVDLPPEIYESTLVQALFQAINKIICWQNDIVSVEKEMARGTLSNLVLVLRNAYGYSLQEAIEQANAMITAEVRLFEQLSICAPNIFPAHVQELERYLASMRGWIRGNLDWSLESYRFSEIDQTGVGKEPEYLEAILEEDLAG